VVETCKTNVGIRLAIIDHIRDPHLTTAKKFPMDYFTLKRVSAKTRNLGGVSASHWNYWVILEELAAFPYISGKNADI
jgi:hypothetical protein